MAIQNDEIRLLNSLFKSLPRNSRQALKHYDGHKRITVYKGDTYINKTTQNIDPNYPYTFIRNLTNLGTKKNPDLKDAVNVLYGGRNEIKVKYNEPGNPAKGLRVLVYGEHTSGELPVMNQVFPSFEEIRKNPYLKKLFEKITGKKII